MKVKDVATPTSKKIAALEANIVELKNKNIAIRANIDGETENLKAKVTVLTKQVKTFLKAEVKTKEYVAEVLTAVKALDPLPPFKFAITKTGLAEVTAVLHLTDLHIGEMIRQTETEGWGSFSWAIAQDRVFNQLLPDFLKWVYTQRGGYKIDNLSVFVSGDMVSGDIHQELLVTNEFPLPVQTSKAGDLLGQLIASLAPHFKHIEVIEVGADNHSRLVRKPQAKQKAQNSMSHLVYHIANKELEKHPNIKITLAEGMKLRFEINGWSFLGEHGDTVRSWMGVPWYGMERERAREATRRMNTDLGFQTLIMGHWHEPWFGSKVIVGGCLGGTSEYDHACGRISRPCQTAFLVGKWGPFGFVPFFLK